MKKMKKIILGLSLVVGLYSCETELLPNDALIADTAYATVADLQLGLNGAFNQYNNQNIITFNSIFTDECKIGADNGGQQVQLYNQLVDASEGNSTAIWQSSYAAINRFSRIIDAAENITPAAADVVQYNNIVGQCYAMRALCHLNLMNHYTVDSKVLTSLSVPYIDFVVGAEKLPRNTVAQVRDGILADLDAAIPLISNTNTFFVTTNFINFVKSKTYLVTGDYPNAIVFADAVIANVPLSNPTQYASMFIDGTPGESIFRRQRVQTTGLIGGVWFFTGTGGAFMEMSNSMYNTLVTNTADPRYAVNFNVAGSAPATNKHLINKYPGSNGIPYFNQEKVMRVSEMYLVKAEAQARLSQFVPAATTMKALRDARLGATVLQSYANMNEAATAMLAERKIELAYEGHRYVDVKRLRDATNIGIVRNSLDCGGSAPCTLAPSDFKFTLPIPVAEIGTNPVIAAQQNPGY
jgi:hypothetical protein